eukprot:gene3354-3678_t
MTDEGEEEQVVASKEIDEKNQGILYKDEKIKITKNGILLYSYWFPFGLQKFIPFEDIKHFELRKNVSQFFMKGWGIAADLEVWWPMDFKKMFGDRHAIVLDTGDWPKIGFCPEYGNLNAAEKVYAILEEYCHER